MIEGEHVRVAVVVQSWAICEVETESKPLMQDVQVVADEQKCTAVWTNLYLKILITIVVYAYINKVICRAWNELSHTWSDCTCKTVWDSNITY